MQSNAIRSTLDIINVVLLGSAGFLTKFGCSDVADKLDCSAASVPAGLLKYVVIAAAVITFGRIGLKALTGVGLFTKGG